MDTLEGKAFEIAEEFTLKVLENPNNSIVCCEQGGQYVVDYFNTIYDGILSKLHSIEADK